MKNERRGLGWGRSLRWAMKGEWRVDVREDSCGHREWVAMGLRQEGQRSKEETSAVWRKGDLTGDRWEESKAPEHVWL